MNLKRAAVSAIRRYGEPVAVLNDGRVVWRGKAVINLYRKPISREVYGMMKVFSAAGESIGPLYSTMLTPDAPVYEGSVILWRGLKMSVLGCAGVPAGGIGDAYISALMTRYIEEKDDYGDLDEDCNDGA